MKSLFDSLKKPLVKIKEFLLRFFTCTIFHIEWKADNRTEYCFLLTPNPEVFSSTFNWILDLVPHITDVKKIRQSGKSEIPISNRDRL